MDSGGAGKDVVDKERAKAVGHDAYLWRSENRCEWQEQHTPLFGLEWICEG